MVPTSTQKALGFQSVRLFDQRGEEYSVDAEDVLPRERFDELAREHHRLAFQLLDGLGSALSSRLRFANAELRVLEET